MILRSSIFVRLLITHYPTPQPLLSKLSDNSHRQFPYSPFRHPPLHRTNPRRRLIHDLCPLFLNSVPRQNSTDFLPHQRFLNTLILLLPLSRWHAPMLARERQSTRKWRPYACPSASVVESEGSRWEISTRMNVERRWYGCGAATSARVRAVGSVTTTKSGMVRW